MVLIIEVYEIHTGYTYIPIHIHIPESRTPRPTRWRGLSLDVCGDTALIPKTAGA